MKITQELENKIRNCVDKKYAEEAKKLRTELDETKARKSEFYADLAETIAKEHPEFEVFFYIV